jgi:hypothetical protein
MGVRWFAAIAWVSVLWASGCGEDKPPLFDPSTFSGMHQAEIMKDCAESLQCRVQIGMELPDNPMQTCLEQTAERLESSGDIQQSFLRNFGRCSNFVVCDYYNCAISDASGYGDTQRDKVSYDCNASIDCDATTGKFTGDKNVALPSCIAIRTGALDTLSQPQRQSYEATFAMCSMLQGCEFTNCFSRAMSSGMTTSR